MSEARLAWISGPVLRARTLGPFSLREAVRVEGLLGEVVKVEEGNIVVQVYGDTSGLRPGTLVEGSGLPMAVRLGPGLLGGIFDGLLRPLTGPLSKGFLFVPRVKVGDALSPGTPFGEIPSKGLRGLVPPDRGGRVVDIVPEGTYGEEDTLCILEGGVSLSMTSLWPVRVPRPVAARLPPQVPLLTGIRILDSLFPVARGSRAAIPGGFGTGKTILLETLAKGCDADVIVYVGCGERGNEIAEVLEEFPALEDPRTGRPLMERMVIIANTSNMPVAAREASIYSAVTVAEYFRDQGLHVALMADSTSRWAEALREVSGRLGELPGEEGYPAYLASRLAEFYERASWVRTLSGEEGSVTLMGAVSPPAGDLSEPVVSHTKRYVRCFWVLDTKRAQARFYPAIDPLLSYSEDAEGLARWWMIQGNPRWPELRRRFLSLLQEGQRLERMARILGAEALPPRQQLILLCAELLNEGFLRQSAFSPVDRFASSRRQTAMMRIFARFFELAEAAMERGLSPQAIRAHPLFRQLSRLGEEIGEGEWERFKALEQRLEEAF